MTINNIGRLSASIVLAVSSTTLLADIWEPGVGIQLNYAPIHQVEGDSGNEMDGSLLGAGIRYANASEIPVTLGLSYQMGSSDHVGSSDYSSAKADSTIFTLDVATGKVFFPGNNIELIPYIGMGFRQMEQDFTSKSYPEDNDIATPSRTQRHMYLPLGLYLGSASALDKFDFYVFTEYRHILMGETKLEKSQNITMNSQDGRGFRAEAGMHFPGFTSSNIFAGVYYEQWNIDPSDRGVSTSAGTPKVERDTGTKQISSGITIGFQF